MRAKCCNPLAIMDVKKEFGSCVRAKRNSLGLSQFTLAQRAKLPRTYIADVERGSRNLTIENISKLAGAFGLPISQLFSIHAGNGVTANASPVFRSDCLVDILLAEDNPEDIATTLTAFKRANLTNSIHLVSDGEAALDFVFCQGHYQQRLWKSQPGAVLLDITLPRINGLDVLSRIKADSRTHHIKVVMLADSRTDRNINEALRLGAAGVIFKPVNFHDFSQITSKLGLFWGLIGPATEAIAPALSAVNGGS